MNSNLERNIKYITARNKSNRKETDRERERENCVSA